MPHATLEMRSGLHDHDAHGRPRCRGRKPGGSAPARVATVAMFDFLIDYRRRGEDAYNDFVIRTKDHPLGGFRIFNLAGFPRLLKIERQFLPPDSMERYSQSLGAYDPRAQPRSAEQSAAGKMEGIVYGSRG